MFLWFMSFAIIYHDLSSYMIYLEIISTSSPSDLMTDGSEYMGMI